VAAKLAGNDPGVARKTEIFLDKQAQILDTQNQHLKEEHVARLHFLQGQAREVDIRRFGLRLRVGFQLFLAILATSIGIGLVVMVRDAVTSRSVVIDSFDAPPVDVAAAADARALLAEERGDLKEAAREWDTFAVEYANPIVSTTSAPFICYAAVTYEKTGQPAKADAALNAVGKLTLVDCYRFRGDVLDLRGDWAAAQEWYAKAVRLAPSIPSGYYSWGVALAKHGDLDGAAAKFKDANQKGPHWADPLKAWGDVLVKQGKNSEALAKFDEAAKYAPNWKELNEAREMPRKVTR